MMEDLWMDRVTQEAGGSTGLSGQACAAARWCPFLPSLDRKRRGMEVQKKSAERAALLC